MKIEPPLPESWLRACNTCTDARMEPKELPEHLQPLMQDLAADLTLREIKELAAAIYEYRDVFSSGPADMGQTDLVLIRLTLVSIGPFASLRGDFLSPNKRWNARKSRKCCTEA